MSTGMDSSDGIAEAVQGQLRVLITAAGQVGEQLARAREQALRRAEAASAQTARELHSRIEAERHAARVALGSVHRGEWWDHAAPEQIATSYQLARAWARDDPEAARAEQRIREELRTRYGIDVADTGADPAAVRQAVERATEAERDRTKSQTQRARADAEREDARRLMVAADRQDRLVEDFQDAPDGHAGSLVPLLGLSGPTPLSVTAERAEEAGALEHPAQMLYDSVERREVTARELEARGIDSEIVATRMRADLDQAKPPTVTPSGATAQISETSKPGSRRARPRAEERQQ